MGYHIEKTLGIPRSTRQHANWRSNVTNRQIKSMKKFFNDNGINIFAFKSLHTLLTKSELFSFNFRKFYLGPAKNVEMGSRH